MIKKKRCYIVFVLTGLILVLSGILFANKIIKVNFIFADGYEIRGADVSHYQGVIDWNRIAQQDLDFAFIKATEGSGYLDEYFYDNWQEAEKTDLYIGAYHFFSFDSEGKNQAEFYIDTVGELSGKLPPVIDVEFYGSKANEPPEKEEVAAQLGQMLTTLEEYYQVKPIIYTTYQVYNRYLKGEFDEYPLWIRNVYYPPFNIQSGNWTFWQYTDRAVLEGYEGDEKYIDMNVFHGTKEELNELIVTNREAAMEPFYQYYEEDSGQLQLVLFYDEQTGKGSGVRYYPEKDRTPEEFVFDGSGKDRFNYEVLIERLNADPYGTLAINGTDLSQDINIMDYEEETEYTDDGRLQHYISRGWITYISEEKEIDKLLEIDLTYREDGTLKQRDYVHNTIALETWQSSSHSYYDELERLVYEDCYITHGSMDYYYIYEEEERTPSYCLVLDHNMDLLDAELFLIE